MVAPVVGNGLTYWQKWTWVMEIDDIKVGGFTKCSGIKETMGVVRQEEGGARRSVGISNSKFTPDKVTLSRGSSNNDEIYQWWLNIKKGNQDIRNASLVKQDGAGNPLERWNFTSCALASYAVGDFDGDNKTENAMESIEFEYIDCERKQAA